MSLMCRRVIQKPSRPIQKWKMWIALLFAVGVRAVEIILNPFATTVNFTLMEFNANMGYYNESAYILPKDSIEGPIDVVKLGFP